ncbi:MAG: glutaredoxin family protein [Pseudomonadota bacterium]|nr:glutaredoxin family protein [Pseudomonadota bacterium]
MSQLPFLSLTSAALLLAASAAAQAQTYRVVGPDGRVTYSDRPPAADARTVPGKGSSGSAPGTGSASLPYELSQTARRFPVTLYTGTDCAPCASGRSLLASRGIPFTEKTVSTRSDADALQQLFGDGSLPALSIGNQQLKGFNSAQWTQYLDAAGYPKASQLPSNYRQPAATPLTTPAAPAPQERSAPAARSAPATAPAAPSIAPERTNTNPAGIRF